MRSIYFFVWSLLLIGGLAQSAGARPDLWIGTWTAVPQPFAPGALRTFNNETVRLVAHVSIGGRSVRLHLSNTYGDKPLILGPVRVAIRSNDADTLPGTTRIVRFAESAIATIPAGASITSDPVGLEISRSTDLVVSLFFPRKEPATTSHLLAMQSGYVSSQPGDLTGANHFKIGETLHSWPFLTGVDVYTADAQGAAVVFGDSLVDGDGSTENANHRWPDEIARVLNPDAGSDSIAVLAAGIVGNRLLRGSPHEPPSEYGDALGEAGVVRFERDVLSSSANRWVIVRLGINDIGMPGTLAATSEAPKAPDMISGYEALIQSAHRHHVKIYLSTLGPFEGADELPGYYSPDKEAVRQEVNAWIRTGAGFDGVIDADAMLRDPEHPARLLPTFDSGDHLHPNDAGNAVIAVPVTRRLLGLIDPRQDTMLDHGHRESGSRPVRRSLATNLSERFLHRGRIRHTDAEAPLDRVLEVERFAGRKDRATRPIDQRRKGAVRRS